MFFKKRMKEENTPDEETPVEPETPEVAPIEEPEEEKLEVSSDQPEVDRSAYNCEACGGEGLVGEARCLNCHGTGKV